MKSQPTTYATPPVSGSHRQNDAGDTAPAMPACSRLARAFGLAVIDQAARLSPCADWARLLDSHARHSRCPNQADRVVGGAAVAELDETDRGP